jgi:hypothetical protein
LPDNEVDSCSARGHDGAHVHTRGSGSVQHLAIEEILNVLFILSLEASFLVYQYLQFKFLFLLSTCFSKKKFQAQGAADDKPMRIFNRGNT